MQKRNDAVGLFWNEEILIKEKKVREKIVPPDPFWLEPGYLPYLDEATADVFDEFTDQELIEAQRAGDTLFVDVECYPNYFLVAFRSYKCGKVLTFELTPEKALDKDKLRWVLMSFLTVGFNTNSYDLPIIAIALAGATNLQLKDATWQIIVGGMRGYELLKMRKIKTLVINHIDLIEVAPLSASLKMYAGRLHSKRMMDLPFHPEVFLSGDQIIIVRWYCVNDLEDTKDLYEALIEQLRLREKMSAEYGIDLRSKSDAQIAEAVITHQVQRLTGHKPKVPIIAAGTGYRYQVPSFLQYKSALMNWVLEQVKQCYLVVDEHGKIAMPRELSELEIPINRSVYRMGVGGLHSTEKRAVHKSNEDYELVDRDVVSFYPLIVLLTRLYPDHIGTVFLEVYKQIVDTRIRAKQAGDKITADALKITVNGTFGKLSSPYSPVYSPRNGVHVTITGQLVLLMLIERLELAGVEVVSANTDGIVFKRPRARKAEVDGIITQWERDTGFETEETLYKALYSRDVNNYVAVTVDGKVKLKGDYSNPWNDPKLALFRMHKNPEAQICKTAVVEYLTKDVPLMTTIKACNDIREFVSVRKVSGGAVKDKTFLGKAIRWYYSTEEIGKIIISAKGSKVPKSDGARPLMLLPKSMPADVDYIRYEEIAKDMLENLGVEYNVKLNLIDA